jgi:hypothetical protein
MPVLYANISGVWTPINFATPPEVHIGPTQPTGNETMWIDTSTNPPTTKAFIGGTWVTVGAVSPNEVFVGPSDPLPADPQVELWYDSDAVAPSVPGGVGIPGGGATGQVLTKASATSFDAAWANAPRGLIASHTLATVFVTTSSHMTAQDEGLTVTFTEVAGRNLRFTVAVQPYVSGGANGLRYSLARNGVIARSWDLPIEATSANVSLSTTFTHFAVAAGGAATWKVQLQALNSNTAVNSYAIAAVPRCLFVEDVG